VALDVEDMGAAEAGTRARRRGTLAAAILGSGAVFLDATIVTVALASIGTNLPSRSIGVFEGQAYVYNGYLLSLSALLILAGALADAYGRRRTFALGFAAFGIASVLCAFAPSIELLVAFRVLQGAAGAFLVPGSLAILTAEFSGVGLGRALGIWAGASAATTVVGPFVGGLLVESVSWRGAFLVNAPIVVIGIAVTLRWVRESRDESVPRAFDWGGAALGALAVGGLSFGAIYGQQRQWTDPLALAALLVGAAALAWFLLHMVRGAHPLVPLGLFRVRDFAVTNASTFLVYGVLYVVIYLVPTFAQGTLGYSAAAAGLVSLPVGVLIALLSPLFGHAAGRFGPRRFMALGPALVAAGLLWLVVLPGDLAPWRFDPASPATLLPPASTIVAFLPWALVEGLGMAILVAPLTTALMTSLPPRNAGLASAINNAVSRVGPQLLGALLFILVTAGFYAGLADRLPGVDVAASAFRTSVAPFNPPTAGTGADVAAAARVASIAAFRLAMAIGAGVMLAGGVLNLVGIRPGSREGVQPLAAPWGTPGVPENPAPSGVTDVAGVADVADVTGAPGAPGSPGAG
jgi:EmrB/QacA subfamily drug resistance transporter